MNDRELLELAAKAAGVPWQGVLRDGGVFVLNGCEWNPLEDDGDALRLSAALRISVLQAANHTAADIVGTDDYAFEEGISVEHARRVIVRAAAEIGRAMP